MNEDISFLLRWPSTSPTPQDHQFQMLHSHFSGHWADYSTQVGNWPTPKSFWIQVRLNIVYPETLYYGFKPPCSDMRLPLNHEKWGPLTL